MLSLSLSLFIASFEKEEKKIENVNGRKTETISIQRLLHRVKVLLSLSSLYFSGEGESRSNNFVCRILRSSRDARKTSH